MILEFGIWCLEFGISYDPSVQFYSGSTAWLVVVALIVTALARR